MEAESIARIRELEVSVQADIKNSNSIIEIKKTLLNSDAHQKVRLAALHSLRRLFRQFFEEGKFEKVKSRTNGGNNNSTGEKLEKFRLWLKQQYISVKNEIMNLTGSSVVEMQVPSIRTIIEFACLENENLPPSPHTGINTFHSLMESLLLGSDIDIDVLLMLKDEVFSKQDCVYHTLRTIHKALSSVKSESKLVQIELIPTDVSEISSESFDYKSLPENLQQIIQNALDIVRLVNIAYPTETEEKTEFVDPSTFLLPPSSIDNSEQKSDSEGEGGGSDVDSDDDEPVKSSLPLKRGRFSKKRTLLMDETSNKKKKMTNLNSSEKIVEKSCHLKEFSKTWLLLFSLPMTKTQRRLALKHLSVHVTPYLVQPVLLADYLIVSVNSGGVVGILALESLFQIILTHNLDYPNFFEALYRLCTVEILSAKYRSKFTSLLHTSLKSTNLPAYTIAAFVKRLFNLAMRIPGPSASFCVAEGTTLLRNHPQCLKLIHNSDKSLSKEVYNGEVNDTNMCNAFSTSLFEAVLLQQHYIPEVALMAKALENDADTTSSSRTSKKNVDFDMKKLMSSNYQSLIEESLKGSKSSAPLAFVPPSHLFTHENIIGKCFGS